MMRLKEAERGEYQSGRWLTMDLHIHSTYSREALQPTEILEYAQTQLLDAVAISDHYETQGVVEARDWLKNHPYHPLCLTAQEVSAGEHFHFVIIGGLAGQNLFRRKNLIKQLEVHHRAGGVVIMAHPWTAIHNSWVAGCLKELLAENLLDGMELCNASLMEMSSRAGGYLKSLWEEWVVPYGLGITGGSDCHQLKQHRYPGAGRTYLKVVLPGEAGIIEALRARRMVGGVFSEQLLGFDWGEPGKSLLIGLDPWLNELQKLRDQVKAYLDGSFYLNPVTSRLLSALLAAGHYQRAIDLLAEKA